MAARALLGDFAQVLAVDQDGAGVGVVEAEQQARDGGLARAGRADHGHGLAGRNAEADALQDRPALVVAETHVAEFDFGAGHGQIARAGPVGDLAILVQQLEHALHVDDGLLDLAVDEAEEAQRRIQLQQVGVDQHEVAQRVAALGDALGGHPHDQRQARGNDGGLADVQDRQADLAAHGGALVAAERGVEAPRLVLLVAEVLDRLVVQQAFDGLGVGLGVGLVHLAAELGSPFGDQQRVGDVQRDRGAGGQRQPAVEHAPQHHADQSDLEERGQDVEQQEGQRGLDALGAAFDGAVQPAGLARQVSAAPAHAGGGRSAARRRGWRAGRRGRRWRRAVRRRSATAPAPRRRPGSGPAARRPRRARPGPTRRPRACTAPARRRSRPWPRTDRAGR